MENFKKAIELFQNPVTEICQETGLHHGTIKRAMQGKDISYNSYMKLKSWVLERIKNVRELESEFE